MKRYRFRLEPVLRVRRNEEDAARGALLAATATVAAQERLLEERTAAYARALAPTGSSSVPDFQRSQQRREALGAAVVDQRRRLEQAVQDRETARLAWSEAAARVGALERLDERARAEHRLAEQREDDLVTDELVVARHGREHG